MKCLFPAQLKLKLNTREKTFTILMNTAAVLRDMGVEVRCGERERIKEESKEGWRSSAKRKRDMVLSALDLKAFLQEED